MRSTTRGPAPPTYPSTRSTRAAAASREGRGPRGRIEDHDEPLEGQARVEQVGDEASEAVDATDTGAPHGDGDVGVGHDTTGEDVAVLDVGRAGVVGAVEVGIELGHDEPGGRAQTVEGGLDRDRSQRRPVPDASESEQESVATLGSVERQLEDRGRRRAAEPVELDELGQPGHDVDGVVGGRRDRLGATGRRARSALPSDSGAPGRARRRPRRPRSLRCRPRR